MTHPLTALLAAFRGLFHRSPSASTDPMANNTPLADATQQLKTATGQLQLERQHTAAQAQQLITITQQRDDAVAALSVERQKSAALEAQLDALPDAQTVADAITEITQDAGVIAPAPSDPSASPPATA